MSAAAIKKRNRQRSIAFSLTIDPKVDYSERERAVFDLLPIGEGDATTTSDIVEGYYGKDKPLNAQRLIHGVLRSLQAKARINDEPFTVATGKRRGHKPMEVWLDDA